MDDDVQFIVRDLSVFICNSIIWLCHCCGLVITDFGTSSFQCSLSDCTSVLEHMFQCSSAHTLQCCFIILFFCQYWACWCHVVCYRNIVDTVCICCLFLFPLSLLHGIWFLAPELSCYYSAFTFCFQISLHKPSECVLFDNKLSICTSNVLSMHCL